MSEAKFTIPKIYDNPDGWGPSTIPDKFKDIPYHPYSKEHKLGKAADFTVQPNHPLARGRYSNQYGSNVSTIFSYYHYDDDESFQMVENKPVRTNKFHSNRRHFPQQRQQRQFHQQQLQQLQSLQGGRRQQKARQQQTQQHHQQQQQYPNRRYPPQGRNRYGNSYESKRPKDFSIEVRSDWNLVDQIDFSSLSKLNLNVDEPQDLVSCGTLEYYDKSYDRVTTKTEKNLERTERKFFKITTSDDPIIQQLAREDHGPIVVFGTDAILSHLMASPRSVNSWDILIHRLKDKLFFDKRDNSQFDYLTVNETANEPPSDEKDHINSPHSLSQEATFINQNFSQQILLRGEKGYSFEKPNPFASTGEDVASVAYRYRKWNLGDGIVLIARCELDGAKQNTKGKEHFLTIKALNEFDPKTTGVDWRQKLDTQRGAVLATELKNNGAKLARWTAQSLLSGAHALCLGYVSRSQMNYYNHVILGTQFYKPKEFATQIALNIKNLWGILKHIIDVCLRAPEGKYILLKDPNKPTMLLYEVPKDTFEDTYDDTTAEVVSGTSSLSINDPSTNVSETTTIPKDATETKDSGTSVQT